ncbi:hypothetical protein DLM78_09920 [Leptospira stimsonii]|uniref:Uncharacterized protein n=1 Tax=Leptospira stimsonii TaxID=2202203 RepID=A0A8B3CQX2_9LEPT|nr:hypothetical protein DLM78_09920 [Leptospira stimsonii]
MIEFDHFISTFFEFVHIAATYNRRNDKNFKKYQFLFCGCFWDLYEVRIISVGKSVWDSCEGCFWDLYEVRIISVGKSVWELLRRLFLGFIRSSYNFSAQVSVGTPAKVVLGFIRSSYNFTVQVSVGTPSEVVWRLYELRKICIDKRLWRRLREK